MRKQDDTVGKPHRAPICQFELLELIHPLTEIRQAVLPVEQFEATVSRSTALPVEVRCYISCFRCLARNARCNTISHLTTDAVFSYTSYAVVIHRSHCRYPMCLSIVHIYIYIYMHVYVYMYVCMYVCIYIYIY